MLSSLCDFVATDPIKHLSLLYFCCRNCFHTVGCLDCMGKFKQPLNSNQHSLISQNFSRSNVQQNILSYISTFNDNKILSLVNLRSAWRKRSLPSATLSCVNMQRLWPQPHDLTHPYNISRSTLHDLCIQNEENSGKFQRGEIYWIHYVLHMHRIPCFYSHLFRY